VARENVGDLQARSSALVPSADKSGVRDAVLDPLTWSDRTPLSWKTIVLAGVGMLGIGLLGATLLPIGVVGLPVWGGLVTMGGGLVFLGGRKARMGRPVPPRALSASEVAVLQERARRVRARIQEGTGEGGGEYTFERLVGELRWTDEAVLSALLHMRDTGDIIEDLNLDTGQWVYRLQDPAFSAGSDLPPMLEERRAQYEDEESSP
jgi:hypothetical protein